MPLKEMSNEEKSHLFIQAEQTSSAVMILLKAKLKPWKDEGAGSWEYLLAAGPGAARGGDRPHRVGPQSVLTTANTVYPFVRLTFAITVTM